MIEVMSGDVITVQGKDVKIPYADQKSLTKSQMDWLDTRGIKVTILKKRRKLFTPYKELCQFITSI